MQASAQCTRALSQMTSTPRLAVTSELITRQYQGLPLRTAFAYPSNGKHRHAHPEGEIVRDVLVDHADDGEKEEHRGQDHGEQNAGRVARRSPGRSEDRAPTRLTGILPRDRSRVHMREPEDADCSEGEEQHVEVGFELPPDRDEGAHEHDTVHGVLRVVGLQHHPGWFRDDLGHVSLAHDGIRAFLVACASSHSHHPSPPRSSEHMLHPSAAFSDCGPRRHGESRLVGVGPASCESDPPHRFEHSFDFASDFR